MSNAVTERCKPRGYVVALYLETFRYTLPPLLISSSQFFGDNVECTYGKLSPFHLRWNIQRDHELEHLSCNKARHHR